MTHLLLHTCSMHTYDLNQSANTIITFSIGAVLKLKEVLASCTASDKRDSTIVSYAHIINIIAS